MTAIRDLCLAAAEELDKRELCQHALAQDAGGHQLAFQERQEGVMFRDFSRNVTVSKCDEVRACCAVGSLDLAMMCRPALRPEGSATQFAFEAIEVMDRVLLAHHRDEVRAVLATVLDAGDLEYDTVDDALDALDNSELTASFVGQEGLVPAWNDYPGRTKGEVVALLREAAEAAA